jgi:hypothetical protein
MDEKDKFWAFNGDDWSTHETALACCRWLSKQFFRQPQTILEPGVGGGAWVRAARKVWPEAMIHRCDSNPDAPGLYADLRAQEWSGVGDFLELWPMQVDLVLGNPPYSDAVAWVDRARALGPTAFLLRESFTGSMERLPWLQASPPRAIVKVLPRPAWGGPGARASTDSFDSVLVWWEPRRVTTPADSTRFEWLDTRGAS